MGFPEVELSKDVGISLQDQLQEKDYVDKTNSTRNEIRFRSDNVRDEQVIETELQSDEVVEEKLSNPTIFVTDCV